MEKCEYCKNKFKRVASHINHCQSRPKGNKQREKVNTETPTMTPCPHCKKLFKRVAGHIYRCPERPEDEEISDEEKVKKDSSLKEDDATGETPTMTPCPYCKKMFKRVAGHIYRCPKRPDDDEEISDEENVKKDSSLKEDDGIGKTPTMTPCPHCKKLFKRVAAHIYRCPERPEDDDEEISDDGTVKKDSSLKENDGIGETPTMTPCPHCKKMFKRVAGHIYRCPERPDDDDEDEEISDEGTVKRDSSFKENDASGETPTMTPCPHCKKMFKRVAGHIYQCPERPEDDDEEISDEGTVKRDSSFKENDARGETPTMTPCPHCKKMFKWVAGHIYRCPERPEDDDEEEEEISDEENVKTDSSLKVAGHNCRSQSDIKEKRFIDYPTYKYLNKTENSFDQSKHRPILKSPTKFQGPESENGDSDKLSRPPLHEDYLTSSPKQKSPSSIYSDVTKPILYSFSANSHESYQSKPVCYSKSTPGNLQRPPIHGDHSFYEESIDGSFTDFDDDSFYKTSESEDSFSYLQQDLKRPPIHKGKSSFLSEKDKNPQFLDERELFEFSHTVLRE